MSRSFPAAPPAQLPVDGPPPRSVVVARVAGAVEVVALLVIAGVALAYAQRWLSDGSDPHADFADLTTFIWRGVSAVLTVAAVGTGVATATLRRARPGARTTLLAFQAVATAVGLYYLSGAVSGLSHGGGHPSTYPPLIAGTVAVAGAVVCLVALGRPSCFGYCDSR